MDNEATMLIENFNEAITVIRENRSIDEQINKIRNDCKNKINSEQKKNLDLSSNIKKEYDEKIDEIRCNSVNSIYSKKNENVDLNNKIEELKEGLIFDKTKNVDKEIDDLNLEYSNLNNKKSKLVNLKNNVFLKYTVLQQTFTQWLLLPIIVLVSFEIIIGLLDLKNNGIMQWIILIIEIGGIVCFKKLYKNDLKSIDSRLLEINSLKEDLMMKKNKLETDINNGSSIDSPAIISLVEKTNNNILEIRNLNEEMNKKINQCELEKKQKLNQLDEISKEELERIILLQKQECDEKIADLKVKYLRNMEFLENECKVTEEYQSENILSKLISYLKNGRAVNRKEALGLYEDEKRLDMELNAKIQRDKEELKIKRDRDEKEMKHEEMELKSKKDKERELEKQKIARENYTRMKAIESKNRLEAEEKAKKYMEQLQAEEQVRQQKVEKQRQKDKEDELKKRDLDEINRIKREKQKLEKIIEQEKSEKQKAENLKKAYELDKREKMKKLHELEDEIKLLKDGQNIGHIYPENVYKSKLKKLEDERKNEYKRLIEKK